MDEEEEEEETKDEKEEEEDDDDDEKKRCKAKDHIRLGFFLGGGAVKLRLGLTGHVIRFDMNLLVGRIKAPPAALAFYWPAVLLRAEPEAI